MGKENKNVFERVVEFIRPSPHGVSMRASGTGVQTEDEAGDKDAHLYRKLSATTRDLTPLTQDRQLAISFWLYRKNPLAYRIIEITKDFTVGEGIKFYAPDEGVRNVLLKFWNDPVNHWDIKQHKKAREIGLYGEQCYPVFVNEADGHVRLGYVDPNDISEVRLKKENCEIVESVILKGAAVAKDKDGKETSKKELKVIHMDEDPNSDTHGRLVGDCFYFTVNNVSNQARGTSDLMALVDWLDAYDQFLFTRLEKAILTNYFLFDVELAGATEKEIDEFAKKHGDIKPAMIRFHNDKVKYDTVVPDLQSRDASEEAKLIKNQILGGAGYPEHWFGGGGDANRATAQEMGIPTAQKLKARQKYFAYMIEHIFNFAIDQAIIKGKLKDSKEEPINRSFIVIMPQVWVKDTTATAQSLSSLSQSLSVAEESEWISTKTASKLFAHIASQLGFEIDVEEEAGKLKDSDKGGKQDYTSEKMKKLGEELSNAKQK